MPPLSPCPPSFSHRYRTSNLGAVPYSPDTAARTFWPPIRTAHVKSLGVGMRGSEYADKPRQYVWTGFLSVAEAGSYKLLGSYRSGS